MLEAEEARKSQLEAHVDVKPELIQEDVEMTGSPVKQQQLGDDDFEDINMQSACKPITIEVSDDDELMDEEELRE